MQLGPVTSVLGIVLAFLSRDAIRDRVVEDDPRLTDSDIDAAVAAGLGFRVMILLLAAGVWLWMAGAAAQGRPWVRTTATVLGGLNLLLTLLGLTAGESSGLSIAVSLLGIALAAAVLVNLYRPDSSQYFDRMSGRPDH